MFNFNKKKSNPITDAFYNLNRFQKMSVVNLMQAIARVDGDIKPDHSQEDEFISVIYRNLDVDRTLAVEYFGQTSVQQMVIDLKDIENNQKKLLLIYCYQLMEVDGSSNETEFIALGNIFEALGLSEERIVEILKSTNL